MDFTRLVSSGRCHEIICFVAGAFVTAIEISVFHWLAPLFGITAFA